MSNSYLENEKIFIHPSCYIKDLFWWNLMIFWDLGKTFFPKQLKMRDSCERRSKMKKQEGILGHDISSGCFQEVSKYARDTCPYALGHLKIKYWGDTLVFYRLNLFYIYGMLLHKWVYLAAFVANMLLSP